MNEEYLGSRADQRYAQTYLANIRRLDPIEIATIEHPIRLDRITEAHGIDLAFFHRVVRASLRRLSRDFGVRVPPLSSKRYYLGRPGSHERGGFHDSRSLGYQYWYRAGFVMILGVGVSKKIRTLELARSYLHDCLHAETFVSFRRLVRTPAPTAMQAKRRVPEVYREQYGINFRNQNGLSYSSVLLTDRAPESINLNLLMDGVVALVVADLLRQEETTSFGQGPGDRNVLADILLQEPAACHIRYVQEYLNEVVHPVRIFVHRWGGQMFVRLVLQSMLTGDLRPLKAHFARMTGIPDAWEKKFKRPEFTLPPNARL